ncbi:MAG: alpha/beta fold hydrolase [Pseudonocardiaceae bacterium]|nr:alpha/beta fold hydrolase [Pseudonocardiaceae bacterium]
MGFDQQNYDINGIDTAVLTAGTGDPLVFLHGAGTVTGFDALLPLAGRYRLIVPLHPGFGASADDPSVDSVHDYRRHYLDLLDRLEIQRSVLIGHSMGGYLAASLAIDNSERISRLVLASPIGLKVPEHPTVDLFTIPPAELGGYLTQKPSIFDGFIPDPPTPEFLADQYRELTSAARLLWESPYDRKLDKWLHRVRMPTLLLWGEADQLIPIGQCAQWANRLPNAEQHILPGVGHLLFDESPDAVDAVLRFVGEPVPA